jgi:hypothetical protein
LGIPPVFIVEDGPEVVLMFLTAHQLVGLYDKVRVSGSYSLSPCWIMNEGVVAKTCCSLEVLTKLTI